MGRKTRRTLAEFTRSPLSMLRLGLELLLLVAAVAAERFDERLDLTHLPNNHVLAHWTFTTAQADLSQRAHQNCSFWSTFLTQILAHYAIFPLGLGQILTAYDVAELHLAMNAGQWDYDRWGVPPEQSVSSGAEMWAWMRSSASTAQNATLEIDTRWAGLRGAIAGVFCASLGGLDDQRTTVPQVAFRPSGPLSGNVTRIYYCVS